ncbi:TonB-dependent receptor domain-containing protein [Glacieibacterium megasporae]|uniref:TonB-dependent receptor domain-containing protein n=1 Tax=Glacieibacterium megasporae TaxID=2835787 RepID=UPI001C1DFC65|nr:TonB-dependent receptor [Polymorphobacter megasporae]UAJ09215.1 TonB-dependent receptor [Polymorphobacter megasporae]
MTTKLLAATSMFAMLATTTAIAQTQPPATVSADTAVAPNSGVPVGPAADEQIVVTGSRIRRALSDTIEPTQIINSQQIETRGYTNIGQALAELPAIAPGINGSGAQSALGAGQTFVDFFGLGTQRTLTLVNGRRFVSSNTASIFGPTDSGSQVDLNTIPTNLVERIDIVAVGGAPIYGSDAISGTVNIVLKHDYHGLELDAQQGINNAGDGENHRIRGLAGLNFGGGRGNITVSGEYNQSSGLLDTDRAVTAAQTFFTTPPAGSAFQQVLITNRRIPALSEQGIPYISDLFALSPAQVASGNFGGQPTVTNAAGQAVRFSPGGGLIPIDFGTASGNLINFSGGNGFSLAPTGNLSTPTKRYLGNILGSYQFTDGVRGFFEGWYSRTRGTNLVAQPLYNTALFDVAGAPNGNLIIDINNPFLTAASRATIAAALPAGQTSFYLGRANTDLQSGIATSTIDLFRTVAGLDGSFHIGDRAFTWEVVGNYGRSVSNSTSPQVVTQNFNNAVDAVLSPTGTITCRPGAVSANIATISPTCAPLNVFGQGATSQAALNYILANASAREVNEQVVATASVTGQPFQLPAGGVGLVLGYEHRDERARFEPGQYYFGDPQPDGTRSAYGAGSNFDPIAGGFYTNEGFGELEVPLVSHDMGWRFIDTFELKAAARYVQNSQAGGDFTWTGGGRLSPIAGLTFVGNYTRAIRAPAITEAFNPTSPNFVLANDPCDSRYITSGPNPAHRAANCVAAGINQPFQSNIVDFTSKGSVSGNPNLMNEKANSWTVGIQARPKFIPRLAINADWVHIDLQDAIVSLGAQDIFNACYDATSYPNDFCGRIDRDPATHQVTFVRSGYLNAASLKYAGLLAGIAYSIPTPFLGATGKISLNGQYQYIDKLERRAGTGDITTGAGTIGFSRHKATADIDYSSDALGLQLQAQYIGPAVFNADEKPGVRDVPGVGGIVFVNASAAFNVSKTYIFRISVDNLFQQRPPYPALADPGVAGFGGGAERTYYEGIIGRSYRVSATVRL